MHLRGFFALLRYARCKTNYLAEDNEYYDGNLNYTYFDKQYGYNIDFIT